MGVLDILGGKKRNEPPKKQVKKTEVKDKFFGGTEVKETTVTQKGNKAQVREDVTEITPTGRKRRSTTIRGDKM